MIEYIKYLPSQENIHSCTANATLLAAEILLSKNNINKHFSRIFLYYMTRRLQGRINERGASLEHTLTAFKNYGVCLEHLWPFRNSLVYKEPSEVAKLDALNYRLQEYEYVSPEEFNNFLDINIPIIIGLRTGRLFWKLKGKLEEQIYKPINDIDNRESFGHAVTIVGNNKEKEQWIIANSMGLSWGDRGYGVLPYSCASNIGEAYVIKNFLNYS